MNKCYVDDCEKPARKIGLCGKHYERKRVHGDVNAYFPNKQAGKQCTVLDCSRPIISSGLCQMHYARKFRHGTTESLRPTYGEGKHIHEQGYIMLWEGKKYVMEHVQLAELALGKPLPEKAVVHHMNEDSADNHTPFNLVICPDQKYHMLIHKRMREYETLGRCVSTE